MNEDAPKTVLFQIHKNFQSFAVSWTLETVCNNSLCGAANWVTLK